MLQPEYQHEWMRQWRRAAIALAEVRRRELAQMSDATALAVAERVLAPREVPASSRPAASSGLVEQQRLFQLHRR
jgi:hypothetical protein